MPDAPLEHVVQTVLKVEADAASFDMDAASELHILIPQDAPQEGNPFYRQCIKSLLIYGDHSWGRQITLGRAFFARKLTRDQFSILNQVGLMLDPPDEEIENWWVDVTTSVRADADAVRNARARSAERLTLNAELERLRTAGRDETPRWTGFEDNTAGYDVESYTVTQYGLNKLAIEVTSSISNPLEFQVTKNEWRVAEAMGEAYLFHIWDMRKDPPQLHVRTVEQVAPHIPVNQEDGAWTVVSIPVGGN